MRARPKYDFSTPHIATHAVLIVRSDDTTIHSFDDIKGKKAAETPTSNFGKLAAAHGAEVVPVQGFNESIDLFALGRGGGALLYLAVSRHAAAGAALRDLLRFA